MSFAKERTEPRREIRIARVYSDGSFNVSTESSDVGRARRLLMDSSDDPDTRLVQIELRILADYGAPKLVESEPPDMLAMLGDAVTFLENLEVPEVGMETAKRAQKLHQRFSAAIAAQVPT